MQKLLKSAGLLVVPVLLSCGVAAHADEWDKMTKITVNEPIEVPGAVLPAGTYVFKLIDSPSDRHIVEVMNEREDHVFATVIAIPNYRLEPTGKTAITFYEVPAGQPQPVRAWFYPGDEYGQEFVYPKDRNLAQATPPPSPVAPEPQPSVAAAEPAPAPAPVQQPQTETPAPQPRQEVAVLVEPPAPPAVQPTPAPAPVMPQTAGNLPLFALLGFLSVGAALALGAFAKREN